MDEVVSLCQELDEVAENAKRIEEEVVRDSVEVDTDAEMQLTAVIDTTVLRDLVNALQDTGITDEQRKMIKNMTDTIRRTLTEEGDWKKKYSRQLDVVASTFLIWRRIRNVVLDKRTIMMIPEISREGNLRLRQNGAFLLYLQYTNLLNHQLRALGMNKDSKGVTDEQIQDTFDDPLSAVMRMMGNDDDEGGEKETNKKKPTK